MELVDYGFCMCNDKNQMVNQKYNQTDKSSSYCITRVENTHTTIASITSTQLAQTSPPPPTKAPQPTQPPTQSSAITTTTSSTLKSTKAPSPSTAAPTTTKSTKIVTTIKPATTEASKNNSSHNPVPPPEEPHSFLSGIALPVMVILAFIGAVFAIRKYSLLERAQSYIRNRGNQQHQTRYDGLENDFDDDPLLI